MGVKVAFLLDYPLIFSLLKYRGVGAFLNKKMRNPNRKNPLNSSSSSSSIYIYVCMCFLLFFFFFGF